MFPIPFNFPFRKKDGSVTTIDAAISGGGTPYTLPTASPTVKGGVKIGSGFSMSGETLNNSNPTPYSLPTASAETLGGVKVGSGLAIDDGVLSVSGGGGGNLYLHTFRFEFNSTTKIGLQLTMKTDENVGATGLWDMLYTENNAPIVWGSPYGTSSCVGIQPVLSNNNKIWRYYHSGGSQAVTGWDFAETVTQLI